MARKRPTFRGWIVAWATLVAVWFLFVAKLDWREALVGGAAAAIAATASEVVGAQHLAPFAPRAAWLFQAWRLPGYVITGTAAIFAALFKTVVLRRPARGVLIAVPFDVGGPDAASAARRALAIALTTAAPNFIVVGIDHDKKLMLVHQVSATGVPELTRRLGAR